VKRWNSWLKLYPGRKAGIIILAVVALVATPYEAHALKESRRDSVRRRIHKVKTWEMSKDLGLDEEQARVLLPALDRYEENRNRLRDEREHVEAILDSLLASKNPRSEQDILENLERIKLIDRRRDAEKEEYERELNRILTPKQRARYELFERDFDTRLRKMIREIRQEDGRSSSSRKDRGKLDRHDSGRGSDRGKKIDQKREARSRKEAGKAKNDSKLKKKSPGKKPSRKSKPHSRDKDQNLSHTRKSRGGDSSRSRGIQRNSGSRTERSFEAMQRR